MNLLGIGTRRALHKVLAELRVYRKHRASVRRLRRQPPNYPIRLHLGCGKNFKPGWTNVDLFEDVPLQLDLREPLPFPSASITEIHTEHFLEHIDYVDAQRLLRESWRVLIPGGRISIIVPDTRHQLESYLSEFADYIGRRRSELADKLFQPPSPIIHILNYDLRQGGHHRYSYDYEGLFEVLERSGFADVTRRAFDGSRDAESSFGVSLFVDAFKSGQTPPRKNEF